MDKDTGLGEETLFEFKHIPKLTRTTRLGKRRISTPAEPGIETLARLGLFSTIGAVAVLCLCAVALVRFLNIGQIGDVMSYLKISQNRLLVLGNLLQ